jgi:hypothetical protein
MRSEKKKMLTSPHEKEFELTPEMLVEPDPIFRKLYWLTAAHQKSGLTLEQVELGLCDEDEGVRIIAASTNKKPTQAQVDREFVERRRDDSVIESSPQVRFLLGMHPEVELTEGYHDVLLYDSLDFLVLDFIESAKFRPTEARLAYIARHPNQEIKTKFAPLHAAFESEKLKARCDVQKNKVNDGLVL